MMTSPRIFRLTCPARWAQYSTFPQKERNTMCKSARYLLVSLVVLCLVWPASMLASGPVTGVYKVEIVRIRYSDSPAGHTYTSAQMEQAVVEIHNFFSELSYGALDMQVNWKDVTLTNNVA